jgi:hypothetical protein
MKYTICVLLAALIFGNTIVIAQPSRPGAPVKIVEKSVPVKVIDQANDFNEKGLPEPTIIADGRSDESAAKIAARLSKYEDDSLSYLIGTLQKAGFYIIDENQKILYQPTVDFKGMGLAFYDYEVVGMLKLSRAGYVTSVGKIADVIASDLPPAIKQRFGAMMLEDLRKASRLEIRAEEITSNKSAQTKRFWAKLMIELGKNFPQPVDLMTATPENAQLNIIQASLWERRLVGDLIAYAKQQGGTAFNRSRAPEKLFRPNRDQVSFLNASFKIPVPDDPCNYAAVETTEVDGAATAFTTIHGQILGLFETKAQTGAMTTMEKVGTGLGMINLALSWAKLVAALSQVQGKITVQEPMPLIRTKSSNTPGERRTLTGKFEIKVNNLRKLNCARLAINMTTGMDFSMPPSGPLSEKPVSWELQGELSFAGQGSSKSGEFDEVVYLLPVDGANRDHHKQETDANGESKIYLEGGKQKKDLTGQKVVPLPRKATVRADIALKNMKDSKQEVTDIASFGLGVATGGGLIGIMSAIPEIGFRMKIPVTAVSVPVRDWTPCSADWGGWINVTREYRQTITIAPQRLPNGNSTGAGVRRVSRVEGAEVTLHPRKPEEMQTSDPKPASVVFHGKHSDVSDLFRGAEPCCGRTEGRFTTRIRKGEEMQYNQIAKTRVSVDYHGSERDYELSFAFSNTDNIPAHRHEFVEILETNCELDTGWSKETETLWATAYGLVPGRYAQRLVNTEGEFLFGSKDLTLPDGSKESWSWGLARCNN